MNTHLQSARPRFFPLPQGRWVVSHSRGCVCCRVCASCLEPSLKVLRSPSSQVTLLVLPELIQVSRVQGISGLRCSSPLLWWQERAGPVVPTLGSEGCRCCALTLPFATLVVPALNSEGSQAAALLLTASAAQHGVGRCAQGTAVRMLPVGVSCPHW